MSLIPNLSDIPDLNPVSNENPGADGVIASHSVGEYDLRVIKAQTTNSSGTGRNGVLLVCDIVGEDEASNLMHTLWFGNDGQYNKDDEDKSNLMWRMVKDFLRAVGLSEDGEIELADFDGLEFSAELFYNNGVDDDGKQDFQPKNEIKRIT